MSKNPTYLNNISNIEKFMLTDFADSLPLSKLKSVINALYDDPDTNDETLIKKAIEISRINHDIPFSSDGICSWKILFDIYGKDSWLEKYKIIRGSSLGELFWPHKMINQCQTINQERSLLFGDRIDLTLYDIKNYLEGIKPKMTFANKNTKDFFAKYQNKNNGFDYYIKDFNLEPFTKYQNGSLQVIDLSQKELTLSGEIVFKWSNRYGIDRKKQLLQKYLDNLILLCEKHPKN